MGVARLRRLLQHHRRVALDTSVFLCHVEANPRYTELTDCVFEWLEGRRHTAVTSTITMTELLVHPYLRADDRQVDEFYALLSTYPNLDWVPPSLGIADIAARMRAAYGLRTPDALQAATAIESEATGLVTNDSAFERVKGLKALVLDHYL